MSDSAPKTFDEFSARFPGMRAAWDQLGTASREGPLEAQPVALVKLALAIGSGQEGPVHSATRKALRDGCVEAAIEQVVLLSASTLGLPRCVAAWTWVRDVLDARSE